MATDDTATGELDRAEENSEGSPISTPEPALRRVPSTSNRTDHKGGWSSIGYKSVMNSPKNFKKLCYAFKTIPACF